MTTDTEIVHTYFAKLGLEPEIADIYLALHTHGPQSISALARNSGVERTRIYRLIDKLLESNLIEVETQYKRGIIHAAPISNLNILISQREQELQSLQDELSLIEQVLKRNSLSSPATRVQFYQGSEGVKQVFWNQTKAKDMHSHISLLYDNIQLTAGGAFFARWVQAMNKRDARVRSVVSDTFLESQKAWRAQFDAERLQHWSSRYVSPQAFRLEHSMAAYDDVTCHFNWKDGKIFAIEIYNQEVATMQRQLFELLWQSAEPTPQQ